MSSKTIYHPLVIHYYLNGLLNTNQINSIPLTTRQYWNSHTQEVMFGYEWVKLFSTDLNELAKTQRHQIIYKAQKLCIKTLGCVAGLFDKVSGLKNVLRKNASAVIETIDYLTTEMPLEKACRVFGMLTNQYYRWKNKKDCMASVLNLCFKTHPHQLTIAECTAIKEAVNAPENKTKKLSTIWYKLMREGKMFCSQSTLYKYAKLLSEPVKKVVYESEKRSIRATYIFEYLHIDTTFLPTNQGMVRAVIVKDNYSKKILHKATVDNGDSKWVAKLLQELFLKYNLSSHAKEINIVSDGGSENKGEVIDWFTELNNPLVSKHIARTKEFIYTNNDIESTFNIFKNEFLQSKEITDPEHADKLLDEFHNYNDNERYPLALYGLNPQEVFDGEIIDKHRFTKQIKQTAKNRHLKNKSGRFCDVCS